MRIKPSEVVSACGVIGWFMTQFFANDPKLKKILKWLFGIMFFGAVLAAIWPSDDALKALDNHQQTATTTGTSSPAINAATSGSNSAAVVAPVSIPENKGPIVVGSINQQGGNTFQTVIITNSAPEDIPPSVEGKYISLNQPEGNEFVTTAQLHLVSKHPVGKLTVAAYAKTVKKVRLYPVEEGFGTGEAKEGTGGASCAIRNAFGDFTLKIYSATSETFRVEVRIN